MIKKLRITSLFVFLMFIAISLQAQTKTVKGTVADSKNKPIVGATVQIKGTKQGVVTDFEGNFSIKAKKNDTLIIKYLGHKAKEVEIGSKNKITVSLQSNSSKLDEVVVVGYSSQKEANVTGAVTTIKADALVNRPVANLQQDLQGLAPGLQLTVNNSGGQPDGTLSMSLRGFGSINGGYSPLIVIDDMPLDSPNELNDINPEDIKSVSVLSDASASAIYGSRASYGVVLITTKSGRSSDGVRINYSSNYILSSPTKLPRLVNSLEFADYMNVAAKNSGSTPIYTQEVIEKIKASMADPSLPTTEAGANGNWKYNANNWANTNWLDELYKDVTTSQRHNLSISGKKGKTRYFVSGSYYDSDGLLRYNNEKMDRYTVNSKIRSAINSWLDFSVNIRYAGKNFGRATGINGSYSRFLHDVVRGFPTNPVTAPNGDYYGSNYGTYYRPGTGRTISISNKFYNNFGLTIKPVKGLKITANLFYNNFLSKYTSHYAKISYRLPNGDKRFLRSQNSFSRQHSNTTYVSPNIKAEYSYSFKNHNFKLLGGFQQELNNYESLVGNNKDLISDEVPSLSTATNKEQKANDAASHWATRGFYGRFNYNYDEKYLLEFVFRRDGSSRYAKGKRWVSLPSMSVGYNLAKENFWPIDDISSFKIRASYGKVGNQNVGNYAYISNLSVGKNLWWITNGSRPIYVGEPNLISLDLTWEEVMSKNLGLDLKAFNNRLSLQANIYQRITKNMIGPSKKYPATLGISPPRSNNAELSSKGFDLILSWTDKIGENFNYSARFVLSNTKTKITKYRNPQKLLSNWYEGQTVGEIWGFETEKIFQTDTEAKAWFDQSKINSSPWQAGDIAYRDLNGDGKITYGASTLDNPGDRRIIGNSSPKFPFSLNLSASYKGFDFSMFWQGVASRDAAQSGPYFYGTANSRWQVAVFKNHLDYWTPSNPNAYFAKPRFNNTTKNQLTQTRYLQDASYLRLKSFQLGYSLPQSALKPLKIYRLRIFFSGENLLTFTNMIDIFDPEAIGGGYGDGKIYPLQRIFSFGINLKL